MYILTYFDEVSDYALAMALPKFNIATTKLLLEKCFKLTPFNVEKIILDSGNEFKGEFDQLFSNSQIVYCGRSQHPKDESNL